MHRKQMKRLLGLLMVLGVLVGMVPVMAGADDISADAFEDALAKDRLALRAVALALTIPQENVAREAERYNAYVAARGGEVDATPGNLALLEETVLHADRLYELAKYISFSPNGRKLFAAMDGGAVIVDLDTQDFRILLPAEGISRSYYDESMSRTLANPEDQGLLWSPDGRHIAIASPRQVLTMMRLAVNILLVDTQTGEVDKVVKGLPDQLNFFSDDYAGGIPFRAGFSPDGSTLYYELYGVNSLGLRRNQIMAYHLATGESELVSVFDSETTTSDAALWPVEDGLLESIAHIEVSGDRGLAIRGVDTADQLIVRDPDNPLEVGMYPRVVDVAGNRGLLYTSWVQTTMQPVFQLFSLDSLSGEVFRQALVIRPDAEPAQRLVQMELSTMMDDTSGRVKPDALIGMLLPDNAKLSPDGQHMLLLAGGPRQSPSRLFVYVFSAQVLGEVDISLLDMEEDTFLGFFEGPRSNTARGLRWLGDNRLAMVINGKYHLFEFVGHAEQ